MTFECYDKFEYKYESLYSSLESSIAALNLLGNDGWELFELIAPDGYGGQYKAILKRKIIVTKT